MSFSTQIDREYAATLLAREDEVAFEAHLYRLSVIEHLDRQHAEAIEALYMVPFASHSLEAAEAHEKAAWDALELMRRLANV